MESARCRAFVTAADKGSFTAAGKVLDYTPSGVSQLVRALEDELGIILLSRENRGVKLTREGEGIYPQVVEFLKRERNMFDIARDVNNLSKGTITIATFTSIATHILPSIIREFAQSYMNVDIKIMECSKLRIEELLSDNTADLAFVSKPNNSSYEWIPFKKDRIVAVVSKDHKLAGNKTYPISECANDNLIMSDSGRDLDIIDLLKSNGITPEVKYSTTENYTAINMAANGLGVNIVNEFITESWKSDSVILPLDPPSYLEFGIALPSTETAAPVTRKFISFAMDKLKGTD